MFMFVFGMFTLSAVFVCQAQLKADGANVITTYQKYNVQEHTYKQQPYYVRVCTQTCAAHFIGRCWRKKTVCRHVRRTRWVKVPKTVTRHRPVYTCRDGWKQSRYSDPGCTTAKCYGCFNGGRCQVPYVCICPKGWTGSRCRTDINECFRETHNCGQHADCENTKGSYKCVCPKGFYLDSDERTCKDIDECQSFANPCGQKQGCQNTVGSYSCSCLPGYTLHNHTCKDINECEKNVCQQDCFNYPGSFRCTCYDGYAFDGATCQDIDECAQGTSGCGHVCTNTLGTFQCSCRLGYSLNWDKRTCSDINECNSSRHGCDHICHNSPGSYWCLCRKGFHLSKNAMSCIGQPCFPILAPRHGSMKCSGLSTEHTCQFTCSLGFKLVGSVTRTCMVTKMWSGDETKCERLHCPFPTAPENGFIYSPCSTHAFSQCSVGCDQGYYTNGTTDIKCTVDQLWEQKYIKCHKRQACEPNPCQHGGKCLTGEDDVEFYCDCSHTGYGGKLCAVGIVEVPDKYPILAAKVPSNPLIFHVSPPDQYVTLTPVSLGVEFQPSNLTFDHISPPRQSLTFTPHQPGLHVVRYYISGPSASAFQVPDSGAVFVKAASSLTPVDRPSSTEFPTGCYQIALGDKCPLSKERILASSTSVWRMVGSLASTSGVVSLSTTGITYPLSLMGANFRQTKQVPLNQSCVEEYKGVPDTEWLIKKRVLTKSFLKALKNSLPKWIAIKQSFNSNTSGTILQTNLQSIYITGKELKQKAVLGAQPIYEASHYALLRSSDIDVTVGNDVLAFSREQRKDGLSVAIDLCTPQPTNVILRPDSQDLHFINNVAVLRTLKQNNWNITISSVQFSKRKTITMSSESSPNTPPSSTTPVKSTFPKGNMAVAGSFQKLIKVTNNVEVLVDFHGTMIFNLDDLDNLLDQPFADQKFRVNLVGNIDLTTKFLLHGKMNTLKMQLTESKNTVNFAGKKGGKCLVGDDFSGFLIKGKFAERDPFLFTDMHGFVELYPSTKLSYVVSSALLRAPHQVSGYTEISDGIKIEFCGNLKFGALRFDNLNIMMQVKHPRCFASSAPARAAFIEFSGSFHGKRKLGIFNFRREFDVRILVHRHTTSEGTFQATVNVLGFNEPVRVHISKTGVRFNVVRADIHGILKANVTFQSGLAQPWRYQRFLATGTFLDHGRSLKVALENNLKKYISEILKKARTRLALSVETMNQSSARLKSVKARHKSEVMNARRLEQEYADVVSELATDEKRVREVEVLVHSGASELRKLREKLENLCQTIVCFKVCRPGNVCQDIYHDFIVEKTAIQCDATCNTQKQGRVEPFVVDSRCNKERCVRHHGTPPLGIAIVLTIVIPIVGGFIRVNGGWQCRNVNEPCYKPNFSYKYTNDPYSCTRPCKEMRVFNTTKTKTCYQGDCGRVQLDFNCLMGKMKCKHARQEVLQKIKKSNSAAARVLQDLTNAQEKVTLSSVKQQKALFKLQSAWHAVNISKQATLNIEQAHRMTTRAHKLRNEFLGSAMKLGRLLHERQISGTLLKIDKIDFKVKVGVEYETTLLPLHIRYSLNGSSQLLSSVLDFNNLNTSLRSMAKELLSTHAGVVVSELSPRRKRSLVQTSFTRREQEIYTLQTFHELCSEFLNRLQVVREVVATLHGRLLDVRELHESNDDNEPNNVPVKINQTIAAEFDVEINDTFLSNVIENDPEILAAKDLEKDILVDQQDRIQLLVQTWIADMERAFDRFSTECSGLEDCLQVNIDRMMDITLETDVAGKQDLQKNITMIWWIFANMTNENQLTSSVFHSTSTILNMIARIENNAGGICAHAPNITDNPTPYKELPQNGQLVLSCQATGDGLSYQWRFNGDILSDQSSNTLLINNAAPSDSGKYHCEASNHIGKAVSSPAMVVVGSPPHISRQPGTLVYLMLSDLDSLVCEATNGSYQWWFKPSHSENYVALKNGLFSRLTFDPVTMDHQGRYFCNVSTQFGFVVSKESFVQVLSYSLPVPRAKLSFTITGRYRQNKDDGGTTEPYTMTLRNILASSFPFNASSVLSNERLVKLTLVWCQTMEADNDVNQDVSRNVTRDVSRDISRYVSHDVCEWHVTVAGSNVSGLSKAANGSRDKDNRRIVRAFSDLQEFIGKFKSAMDFREMSFVQDKADYTFQKSSLTIKQFTLACPLGQILTKTLDKCADCPSGFYGRLKEGQANCEYCSIGFYQAKSGKTFCEKCPHGFTTTDKGSYGRHQCQDERKYFVSFQVVNTFSNSYVLVNVTIGLKSQIYLVRPGRHLLRYKGWQTNHAVIVSATHLVSKRTIKINGQQEIRLVGQKNVASLHLLYVHSGQDKLPSPNIFLLANDHFNRVRVTASILGRSRTFDVKAGHHTWYSFSVTSHSSTLVARKQSCVFTAIDIATRRAVYINEETSHRVFAGTTRNVLHINGFQRQATRSPHSLRNP